MTDLLCGTTPQVQERVAAAIAHHIMPLLDGAQPQALPHGAPIQPAPSAAGVAQAAQASFSSEHSGRPIQPTSPGAGFASSSGTKRTFSMVDATMKPFLLDTVRRFRLSTYQGNINSQLNFVFDRNVRN